MNLTSAWLTVNRNCNNKCSWCYARNVLTQNNRMDLKKAKLAIDQLEKRGVKRLVLIGGEPTIYPYIDELIMYANQKGMHVSITSNGRRFHDKGFAKRIVEARVWNIDFSIKALTREEYIENTGADGLDEMLLGYRNLLELGFEPTTSYVITSNSHAKFDELIWFLQKNSIKKICIQFVKPVVEESMQEILDIAKMGEMVSYIYEKMEQTELEYSIEISFPLCLIDEEVLEALKQKDRIINCCHVPRGSGIILDQDFKILPCNHFAEYPFSSKPLDFQDEKSIEKILNSDVAKKFRTLARYYPAEKCQKCSLWSQCGGGCFTRWLMLDPNDYIK